MTKDITFLMVKVYILCQKYVKHAFFNVKIVLLLLISVHFCLFCNLNSCTVHSRRTPKQLLRCSLPSYQRS